MYRTHWSVHIHHHAWICREEWMVLFGDRYDIAHNWSDVDQFGDGM